MNCTEQWYWMLLGIAAGCALAILGLDLRLRWKLRHNKFQPEAFPLITPAEFRGLQAAVAKLEWSVTHRGQKPENNLDCQNARVGLEVIRRHIAGEQSGPSSDKDTNYGAF